jgi:glycosyltransferase involved in cell wall biosynthesis
MGRQYLLIAATRTTAPEIRVLADSLARIDPDVPRSIVVLDEDPHSLELLEGAGEIRTGNELGIDLDLVGRWVGAYGEDGLIWAAFPHVLASAGEPGDHVLWLEGEIAVVRAPEPFWRALESSDLVAGLVAPSLAQRDGERKDAAGGRPYALQSATAVAHNKGELVSRSVLGWRAGSQALAKVLAEWPVPRDVPTFESIASSATAQLWFNALALSEEIELVRSPDALLSPSQLISHRVDRGSTDTAPLVDGRPLRLLCLRGFDAYQPHLLEGEIVTARLSDYPALEPLLSRRAEALIAAGWTRPKKTKPAYATTEGDVFDLNDFIAPDSRWSELPEGLPLNKMTRGLIRAGMREGTITRSPFGEEGFEQLRTYVRQPARQGGAVGVNRILHAVYGLRPDLQVAFPLIDGNGGLALIDWAWNSAIREMSIPESFLPPRPEPAAAQEEPEGEREPDTKGVNLAGYFTSVLGLGESVRQIALALEAAEVPTTLVQGLFVPPTYQQDDLAPVRPQDAHHDVNIIVINGDRMEDFAHDVGEEFFAGRPTIGVWWWEVDPLPIEEWEPALKWLDEIWVGTDFIRGLIEPHVDVPVWVFPVPVSAERLEEPLERSYFGWKKDETVFLYIWDYHSTEARKNPSGLVEAYRRAFPEGSKTRLVLKCINHENVPEADEKVRVAAAGRDDITIIDRFLSAREKNALLELCDCYVSPHRSEGFGYTPAEAMLLSKPVVMTDYGGTTQYADETVARIVEWAPARVGPDALPYPSYGRWADPDLDDLGAALRWIVEEPEAAAAMAERGRRRIEERHNPVAGGTAMRERLELVRDRYVEARKEAAQPSEEGVAESAHAQPVATARSLLKRLSDLALLLPRRKWRALMDRAVATRTADLRGDLAALTVSATAAVEQIEQEGRGCRTLARRIEERLDEQLVALRRRDDELERRITGHLDEQIGALQRQYEELKREIGELKRAQEEHD